MNPIIFIDELDKVSRTEQGKEIIGILTHLIDQTQNDCFHDKYFNGIDLDLSNALFIFSYNDADAIDRILLDRIHRIKFDHLSLDDKLTITNTYLLPEIYKKMGLEGIISIDDTTIQYIIERYTCEPGVRKLKEVLFEVLGEINLSILKDSNAYDLPIQITSENIKEKFLKDRQPTRIVRVPHSPSVGVINGLWANSLGMGGVLSIETKPFPSTNIPRVETHRNARRCYEGEHERGQDAGVEYASENTGQSATNRYEMLRNPRACARRFYAKGWSVGGDGHCRFVVQSL